MDEPQQKVVDRGFPWRERQPLSLGQKSNIYSKIYVENCMKMKEIGPEKGMASP